MKSLFFVLFLISIVVGLSDSVRYDFTFYPSQTNMPIFTFKNVKVTKVDSSTIIFIWEKNVCKWQIGKSLLKNNKDLGNYLLLQYDEVKEDKDTLFKEQK